MEGLGRAESSRVGENKPGQSLGMFPFEKHSRAFYGTNLSLLHHFVFLAHFSPHFVVFPHLLPEMSSRDLPTGSLRLLQLQMAFIDLAGARVNWEEGIDCRRGFDFLPVGCRPLPSQS